MNEITYFTIRAKHFSRLATETLDPHAKAYYGALAADMTGKLRTAHLSRTVILIGDAAVDPSEVPLQPTG